MTIWNEAHKNTTKIPYGIGKKIVCRNCNKITEIEGTKHRQLIGNCYQFVVKCKECGKYFIDE